MGRSGNIGLGSLNRLFATATLLVFGFGAAGCEYYRYRTNLNGTQVDEIRNHQGETIETGVSPKTPEIITPPTSAPAGPNPYYFAPSRGPEYTIRLNLAHVCAPPKTCSTTITEDQLSKMHEIADSVHMHFTMMALNKEVIAQFKRSHPGASDWKFIAKGLGIPLLYRKQLLNEDRPERVEGAKGASHTAATDTDPAEWAMEISPTENDPGLLITEDGLLTRYWNGPNLDAPFNYPFAVREMRAAFPGMKQYLPVPFCIKRFNQSSRETPLFATGVRSPGLLSAINALHQDPATTLVQTSSLFYGLGDRGYFPSGDGGMVSFTNKWWKANGVAIQDGACLDVDPSKPASPRVVGDALADLMDRVGAQGIISDNFGGHYHHDDNPVPDDAGNFYTVAIPWRINNEAHPHYLLSQVGFNKRTRHFRPAFDGEPDPELAYSEAMARLAEGVRQRFADGVHRRNQWYPNWNSMRPHLEDLLRSPNANMANLMERVSAMMAPIWDEKWGRDSQIVDPINKKIMYLKMHAMREASRRGDPAILSAIYYNYNDTDPDVSFATGTTFGHNRGLSLEAGLAKYLFVLDKPTLQIHPYRAWGDAGTAADNTMSLDVSIPLLSTNPGGETWLKTFLDLKAGRPIMTTAGIWGPTENHYALMYRRYENLLALLNVTGDTLAVRLPERECHGNPGCDETYNYIRMAAWDGVDAKDGSPPVPLHASVGERRLANRDRYRPGDLIVIKPYESLLLYHNEALPFEELRFGNNTERHYLTNGNVHSQASAAGQEHGPVIVPINANTPIDLTGHLQDGNYTDFLELPPEWTQ